MNVRSAIRSIGLKLIFSALLTWISEPSGPTRDLSTKFNVFAILSENVSFSNIALFHYDNYLTFHKLSPANYKLALHIDLLYFMLSLSSFVMELGLVCYFIS
jgi:hypothetical protein